MQSYTVKWHVTYMFIYLYNVKFTLVIIPSHLGSPEKTFK